MKDYQTNVVWDLTLTDVFCVNSQSPQGVFQGLCYKASMISGTVPAATANRFVMGARIQNLATGLWYQNTGTTASPVWTETSGSSAQSATSGTATVLTTGNTDFYITAPFAGTLSLLNFASSAGLATSNTNYVTFSATNLGQAGTGTAIMTLTTAANTTQATGGTAVVANANRTIALTATTANLVVAQGDRIHLVVAATGTLANPLPNSSFQATFVPAS